jgi:diaminopimelate epimerase
MKIQFSKYQGAGNDFVIIDDRTKQFDENNQELVAKLCNRRFGIGADGLILLRTNNEGFEMVYFNSDGRESSMCGNGGRCFAAFAKEIGVVNSKSMSFTAIDGPHEAEFINGEVNLKMTDVNGVELIGSDFFLDTGSPHYVQEKTQLLNTDIVDLAKSIRYNDRFSEEGTNVNFVEFEKEQLVVRTYERGVEDETLACGTGVTAVALVAELKGKNTFKNGSRIKAMGGSLEVTYERTGDSFSNIWLKGPAELVYNGTIEV